MSDWSIQKKLLVTRVLLGLELDHLLAHLETEKAKS